MRQDRPGRADASPNSGAINFPPAGWQPARSPAGANPAAKTLLFSKPLLTIGCMASKRNKPTAKQLGYLERLGYAHTPPLNAWEASKLIDSITGGNAPATAEQQLLGHRQAEDQQRFHSTVEYLDSLDGMTQGLEEPVCAGLRIEVDEDAADPGLLPYDNAFVPYELLRPMVNLLAARGVYYDELERRPRRGKIVTATGHVVEIWK